MGLCRYFAWVVFALVVCTPAAWAQARPQEKAFSSAGVVAETNSMEVLDDRRKLNIGDRISYRVVEERRDPRQLIVTDSGEMEVPLIGRVQASNRTCRELAYRIKELLEKDYFHQATVIIGLDVVGTRSLGKVYLMGQVRSQGALDLPVDENLTVSKAILRAGGFADYANTRKVKLVREVRGEKRTTIVDVDEILKGGRARDPELQPDDLIIVPERLVNF